MFVKFGILDVTEITKKAIVLKIGGSSSRFERSKVYTISED